MTVYLAPAVHLPRLRLSDEKEMWKGEMEKWGDEVARQMEMALFDIYRDVSQGKARLVEYPHQPGEKDLETGQLALFMDRLVVRKEDGVYSVGLTRERWRGLPCRVTAA